MVTAGDISDGNSITRVENYPQVRSLLGLFSRMVSHPSAIALGSLDHLRRMLNPSLFQFPGASRAGDQVLDSESIIQKVPCMHPTRILEIVQSHGVGSQGGKAKKIK